MSRAQLLKQLTHQAQGTVLRRVCTPLSLPAIQSVATQTLARQLITTMQKSQGVGIAAPQVGLAQRMFVAELDDAYDHEEDNEDAAVTRVAESVTKRISSAFRGAPQPSIIINPIIHRSSTRTRHGLEGCLSLPGLMGSLARPVEIDVSYLDERGVLVRRTLTDFRARLFQHEFDHLNGKLFIDHIQDVAHIWTDDGYERTRL